MKNINSLFTKCFITALLITPVALFAQETTTEPAAQETNEPVKGTFEYGAVINNQTVESLSKNSLNFMIQHRFGVIENSDDLYGLFAPSNIRIGLDYGITSRLTAGIGATKNKSLYDLQWKYVIFKQEKPKGMPVTVTYYGDLARSAQDEINFINQDSVYKGSNRLSYFHELMIARKFNSKLSLQAGISYSHYNLVDSAKDQMKDHDYLGAAFVARYKFSPQSSILFDCNLPFEQRSFVTSSTTTSGNTVTTDVNTIYYPKVNLGLGIEVSTGSHQFQFFICTSDAILGQEIQVYNMNNIADGDILLGFNITRQWGF